ncbi:tetratricopeptide repeat protein [Nocardia sp. NPDC051052]|uniref:tetratricopeptide repeat protein n=1 Tax=Nocardia sp. NPDC051052 TaxID=3364322 RepID=UPI003790AB6F
MIDDVSAADLAARLTDVVCDVDAAAADLVREFEQMLCASTLSGPSGEDARQLDALVERGIAHGSAGRYDAAARSFCAALRRCVRIGYLRGAADSVRNIGKIQLTTGRYRQAECAYVLAWELYRRTSWAAAGADCSHGLGVAYAGMGRYSLAEAAFEAARAAFDQLGRRQHAANSMQGLGNVFEATGRYALAEQAHRSARAVFAELGSVAGVAECDLNLGVVYESMTRYRAAELAYRRARSEFATLDRAEAVAECDQNLGIVYEIAQRYDMAGLAHRRARRVFVELGLSERAADCALNLGVVHRSSTDYRRAERDFAHARAVYVELELPEKVAWCDINRGLSAALAARSSAPGSPEWREGLRAGLSLVVPAVLFLDAGRFQFARAQARQAWARVLGIRWSALFEWAAELGDCELVADLVEAAINSGVHVGITGHERIHAESEFARIGSAELPIAMPLDEHTAAHSSGGHRLVAGAILPMIAPPRLLMPDGHLALDRYADRVEALYGRIDRLSAPVAVW